jgi:hypothetical protein
MLCVSGPPVIGEHHHQGVVQEVMGPEEVHQPTQLLVGVGEEPGKDLLHAGEEASFVSDE